VVPEAKVRSAARRNGMLAVKSTDRLGTPDNLGAFQLIDARTWQVIAGPSYNLLAEDVIHLCGGPALAPRSDPKPPAKPKPVAMPSPRLARQAEQRAARLAVAEARASERRARQQAVAEKRADRLRARQARRQEAAEERSRRDATIVAATRRGLSTREIATGLGITRERVRQIRLAMAEARASERRARQQAVAEKRADSLRARQARRQEAAEERSRRDATIVAATRRGLSSREIATGLGITRERVRQILAREGEPTIPRAQILRPPAARTAVTCAACGKVNWRAARDFRTEYARHYCGRQCQGATQRRVTDVQAVLALRAEGASWAAIGRQFRASAQAAQRAVWRHLAESGQLTAVVVEPLWRTRQPPGWHWLEHSTGQALRVDKPSSPNLFC